MEPFPNLYWGNNFLNLEVNTKENSNKLFCKIIIIIFKAKEQPRESFSYEKKQKTKQQKELKQIG